MGAPLQCPFPGQRTFRKGQISLTLDTYSHVLPSMQEEAAEKLDILLTPISISLG
jgi:hypothetical protein